MPEENKLDAYTHAMIIDDETGKPMPKVAVSGSVGGGSGVPSDFPEDFPDSSLLSVLNAHIEKYDTDMYAIKNILMSLGEAINNVDASVSILGDQEKVYKVKMVVEDDA